ncbi:MAG: DNA translocase FtsK [Oscillospiraceae bacterium]|nr:DNA translocase FtsK [Oscillospiraceae bacterium]
MPQKKTPTKKAAAKPAPIRREVGALCCALLSIFCFLGLVGVKALFLNFLTGVMSRFIGYGAYVFPLVLLAAAFILLFHRGRPVRLRVWCALLSPLWLGGLLYLWIGKLPEISEVGWGVFPALWAEGGVISGLLAVLFKTLFSGVGAGILFIIGAFIIAVIVFRVNVVGVIDAIRDHRPQEYEPEPERPKYAKMEVARPKRFEYDVPVDNPPIKKRFAEDIDIDRPGASRRISEEDNDLPFDEPVNRGKSFGDSDEPLGKTSPIVESVEAEEVSNQPPPGFISLKDYQPGKPTPAPIAQAAAPRITRPAPSVLRPPIESPQYVFPPLSLLPGSSITNAPDHSEETRNISLRLCEAVKSFGIEADLVNVVRGPSVARYEFEIAQGMTLNKLTNRADDIALALGVDRVRIAPVSGKAGTVGIEVPNRLVSMVYLRDVLESDEFSNADSRLAFALGKDIGGTSIVGDIFRLTHLLVAGTTGSGKSVCVNSLIISLLYKASPEEVKLILIDPKMVELDIYNGIPHLLVPVVTDPKMASSALQWAVYEMEKRYRLMQERGVRDIFAYNMAINGEELPKVPQMVIIIDELADLMMVAGKEVEDSVIRIAQKARAAGMHLVVATQRPSADVITGLMKSNIPSRIAFTVASGMDSRIILDSTGAERLIGKGDMLYAPLGSKISRVQGCFVHEKEVKEVVKFIKDNSASAYDDDVLEQISRPPEDDKKSQSFSSHDDTDPLLTQAMDIILEVGQASTSMLQRRLKLGYARAARVVDQLEERGLLGSGEGSKPRQILVSFEQWQGVKERMDS